MNNPKAVENLISFDKMDKEKHLELSKKGGQAAQKKLRKRKATKEAVDALLSSKIKKEGLINKLKEMGIEDDELTNQMALVVKVYTLAMSGNMNALQFLLKGFELSELEKENIKLRKQTLKLQKEKLALEKEKNDLLKAQLESNQGNTDNGVNIVYDLDSFILNGENNGQEDS